MRGRYVGVFVLAWLLSACLSTAVFSQQTPATPSSNEIMANASAVDIASPGDLEAMYRAELQSRDRFLAYAGRADEEGYGQVASMFRAVARGEEIHAANLSALLSPSGEVKLASLGRIEPLTTEENLRTALAEQRYERDVLYPQYLKVVRKDKNKELIRTVDHNMAAEPIHFAWYAQALSDLDGYKGGNIDFMVCPVCGNTVRTLSDLKCPLCGCSKDKFERVR